LSAEKKKSKSREPSPRGDKKEKPEHSTPEEKPSKSDSVLKRSSKLQISATSEKVQGTEEHKSSDDKQKFTNSSMSSPSEQHTPPPSLKETTATTTTTTKDNEKNKSKLRSSGRGEKKRELKADDIEKTDSRKSHFASSFIIKEKPKIVIESDSVSQTKGVLSTPTLKLSKIKGTKKDNNKQCTLFISFLLLSTPLLL
jgi:hypothetical protein